MSTPVNGEPQGFVTVETLEAGIITTEAQALTTLLEALMSDAPSVPKFENQADRQRVITWLEGMASDAWSRVHIRFPRSDGPGDHGPDR